MGAITDFIAAKLPSYLQGPNGQAFNRTFAQIGDTFRSTCTFLFKESLIESATTDSFPFHLRNSDLAVVPTEAPSATLSVLRRRWDLARENGSTQAVIDALARLGYSASVWSALDLQLAGISPAFQNNGITYSGFFAVVIKVSGIQGGYRWQTDGKHWQSSDIMWGLSGITRQDLDTIIGTIQTKKHACSSLRFLVIDLAGDLTFPPISGSSYRVIPVREQWEYDTATGVSNEFFSYSYVTP